MIDQSLIQKLEAYKGTPLGGDAATVDGCIAIIRRHTEGRPAVEDVVKHLQTMIDWATALSGDKPLTTLKWDIEQAEKTIAALGDRRDMGEPSSVVYPPTTTKDADAHGAEGAQTPSPASLACSEISVVDKALANAAEILANFKGEPDASKLEQWQACYAKLFTQMNDMVNAARPVIASESRVVTDETVTAVMNAIMPNMLNTKRARECAHQAINAYLRTTAPVSVDRNEQFKRLCKLGTPINTLIGAARSAKGIDKYGVRKEWVDSLLRHAEDAKQAWDGIVEMFDVD